MLKGRRVVSGRKERPRVWLGRACGPWAEKVRAWDSTLPVPQGPFPLPLSP